MMHKLCICILSQLKGKVLNQWEDVVSQYDDLDRFLKWFAKLYHVDEL